MHYPINNTFYAQNQSTFNNNCDMNPNLSPTENNNNLNNNFYNHLTFTNNFEPNINSKRTKDNAKSRKNFIEREGDWICMICKNRNFSFRDLCNRCKLSRVESDKLYVQHMNELMQIRRYNEFVQNQVFQQSNQYLINHPNFNNLNPNLFSPNTFPTSFQNNHSNNN